MANSAKMNRKKDSKEKLTIFYGTKEDWVKEKLEDDLVLCDDGDKEYITKTGYVGKNLLDPYRMYGKNARK